MKKEHSSYIRIAKLFKLMNNGSLESIEELKNITTNDSCPLVQHEALFALGEMGDKSITPFLHSIAESGAHYTVVHEALMSIGTLGSKNDLNFLKKFEKSNDYNISCSAKVATQRINQNEDISKLVFINKSKAIKELFDYKKSNQNRRIQILFQLMIDSKEDSLKAIYECLKSDPCRIVRHEAGFALGEVDNPITIDYMKDALRNETIPIVIHETLFALGTSGNKKALPIIEKFIKNENYVISESAQIARERILYLDKPYSGVRHFS